MSFIYHRGSFSFVVIPLVILLLLFGIFSIVWLRSRVTTMEYSIAMLDKKKRMEVLKERTILMGEMASLLSIQNVKKTGNVDFHDRAKVIYVKKGGSIPYRASLKWEEGRKK